MRIFAEVFAVIFFLVTGVAHGMEVGGVPLPDSLAAGNTKLILNGAGLRKKFFIKVYAAGLYLTQKKSDAAAVIQADNPMAIRMHFIYDGVTPKQLVETFHEGFAAATGGNTAGIQDEIRAFDKFFTKNAQKGDRYDFIYLPETGVVFFANEDRVGTIPGLDFKKALFGVWLGEKPADTGLKNALMGK
jgi:hypothetical protein